MTTVPKYGKGFWTRTALAAALALATSGTVHGQEQRSPGAPQEGIKVHGHWTIDIKNPDGSLASHTEFDNGLGDGGQRLVNLLNGGVTGNWSIRFGPEEATGGISPCQGGTGTSDGWCQIIPIGLPPSGTAQFATLARPTVDFSTATATFTLRGNATALVAGEIAKVETYVHLCSGMTGAACAAIPAYGGALAFTRTGLGFPGKPPVVQVAAGQIIQITVVISFS